jgi:hypothetical protein
MHLSVLRRLGAVRAYAAPAFAVPTSGDGASVLNGIDALLSHDSNAGAKARPEPAQQPAAASRTACLLASSLSGRLRSLSRRTLPTRPWPWRTWARAATAGAQLSHLGP